MKQKDGQRRPEGEDQDEDDDEEEEERQPKDPTSCDAAKTINTDEEEPDPGEPTKPLDTKQQRIIEMQRLKANCKKEELDKLRAKCQILIRDCIGGLLVSLSTQEFKEMEGECLDP